MAIERFSKEAFEAALPIHKTSGEKLWKQFGFESGEYVYVLKVNGFARLKVRSTIDHDGFAKDTGEDSIRIWAEVLTEDGAWRALPKVDAYTTRVKGWDKRVKEKMSELWGQAAKIKRVVPICGSCKVVQPVWKIAGGPNKDRYCSKCIDCDKGFVFMDKELEGWKGETPVQAAESMDTSSTTSGQSMEKPEESSDDAASAKPNGSSTSEAKSNSSQQESDDIFEEMKRIAEEAFRSTPKIASTANSQQLRAIEAPMDKAIRVLAGPGSGKCLGKGTPILMFDGSIKKVEDVAVGDLLMGPDSMPRRVLSLARGFDTMYRINPNKGEAFVCNEPHILSLMYSGNKGQRRDGTIYNVSLPEYLDLPRNFREKLKLWRCEVEFDEQPVELDPYMLGVWLGDGNARVFAITTPDDEIVEAVHEFAIANNYGVTKQDSNGTRCPTYNVTGGAMVRLREMGLLEEKRIPQEYKINSREIRGQVLAGLLDTDGYYTNGYFEIVQKRLELAKDILFLTRSLGLAAYMTIKTVNGETYNRITIAGEMTWLPLRVKRKQAQERKQIKSVLRTGFTIEEVGQGEYYGFEIDGDRLFVLGDFTVTHNTYVIERRYAHLLKNGVSPKNIVAVTFSSAMAQDLQSRILKHNKEVAGSGAENQICTIHALCNRLLQAEGKGQQVPKNWQLKKLVQEIVAELWEYSLQASYARPNWDEVLRAFANAKGNYYGPGQDAAFYEELWGEYHAKRLTEARKRFDASMKAQGLWTFNDMLYECERLLKTDAMVRLKYQQKYQYIIVDEGQDTNHQAMRILSILAQPQNQMFIVGDPDQLLFRFTGATPEDNLYEGFTNRYADGLMFMLETNYRSTQNIVGRSNLLIEKNYAGFGGPYNEVFHKVLNAREEADKGKDVHYQEYIDPADEGAAVAEQVALMIEQGREPGEIFIGSRTRAQLGYLEGPLTKAGVKFINITGGSFWQMSHIAMTLAYLRLADDPSNTDAFQKVYNIASADMRNRDREYCPTRYLGRAFLEEVGNKYDEAAMRDACARRWAYTNGVDDFVNLMNALFTAIPKFGVSGTIQKIIDLCMFRYLQHEEGLAEDDSENGKLADLETVVDIARKFETVTEFLNKVDEMIQAAQDAREKKWDDYVVLSTIHRLKGMERPVVFGLGWSEGEMITADGKVLRVGLLPHTFSLTPPPQNGVLNMDTMSKVEDERCMGFVLVTRAKEEVYLSGVKFYRKAVMHPSRFILEMGLISQEAFDDAREALQ